MKKLYITFGQAHVHHVAGRVFDKDCVGVIYAPTIVEADRLAFEIFNGKFHQHVDSETWNDDVMKYFPRGYVEVNWDED